MKKNSNTWLIILLITFAIVFIGYKLLTREKGPDKWDDTTEFGDINITEDEEEVEVIPENIVDAFGLEYEFTKMPTYGVSTYKPVGWDVEIEDDFIYFIAPEDVDGNYKHTEIAFCVISTNSFFDLDEQKYIREYAHTNIKNHNSVKMKASLVSLVDYTTIKKNGEDFGFFASPHVEFRRESDPLKGGWEPYAQFYIIKTSDTEAVFIGTTGPLNYTMEIEEIAKTLAYNTENYVSNKFDRENYTKFELEKVEYGNMYYSIKKEVADSSNYTFMEIADEFNQHGYRSYFSVISKERNDDNDVELANNTMSSLSAIHDPVYANSTKWFARKDIPEVKYNISFSESINMYGVTCKKILWNYNVELNNPSRKYMGGMMPKYFITYIVPSPDGNNYYFTINFTSYQKMSAESFIEKVMQSAGFTLK